MRPPLNSLLADLRATSADSRATKAADLYGPERLRERMQAAARDGFESVTVPGPDGLDLRDTAAAQAAMTWLRDLKLGYRWDPRGGGDAAAGTGHDLVISWKAEVAG